MLDDITVAARIDDVMDVPQGMLPMNPIIGRPQTYGVARDEGRLYITYCPTTKIVTVRISVPRWLHKHPVNFPLRAIRSVEDIHPKRLSMEVAAALGFRVSAFSNEADSRIPIRQWAVIRASYAADLQVADPLGSVRGAMGIHRRNPGSFSCFGQPISTVQWSSKSLRSKFYAKGLEVENHQSSDPETQAILDRLARRSEKTLRFEVSFRQVRALRSLFRIREGLPTLALMCDPRISALVLQREADRLRLVEGNVSLERRSFPLQVRHVGTVLVEAQHQIANGQRTLGRRKTLTPERLWDLGAAYFLLSGFPLSDLATMTAKSRSTLAELQSELRELGLPPDASFFSTLGTSVSEIARELRPHLLQGPTSLRDWKEPGRVPLVPAPWADVVLDEEDADGPTADEEADADGAQDGLLDIVRHQQALWAVMDSSDIGFDDDLPFPVTSQEEAGDAS